MNKQSVLSSSSALIALIALLLSVFVPVEGASQTSGFHPLSFDKEFPPDQGERSTTPEQDGRFHSLPAEEPGEEDDVEDDLYQTKTAVLVVGLRVVVSSPIPAQPLLVTKRFLRFCSLKLDC